MSWNYKCRYPLAGWSRRKEVMWHFNWDEEVKQYSIANAANVDCILLGRKTAMAFIPHWKSAAANPKDAEYEFGALITGLPKAVFSRTLEKSEWPNVTVACGEIVDQVDQLKRQQAQTCLPMILWHPQPYR